MKSSTLVYFLTNEKILLAKKKRGFGVGKWNGYGGKLKAGETIHEAATREALEESGLIVQPQNLNQVAQINFFMGGEPVFACSIFFARTWTGELTETEEMRPQWYPHDELPWEQMWISDPFWLPQVLSGKKICADAYLNAPGDAVERFIIKEWIGQVD